MKKKISLILLCGVILLSVCGCDNKPKNDTKPKEEKFTELKNLGSIGNIYKYDIKCNEIKDIIDFSFYDSLFITNDGKLYQLSFDKIFSNEKSCKQVESNNTFKKFIRGGILNNQNNIYYFDKNNYQLKLNDFENSNSPITMPYFIKDIDKSNYLDISSTDPSGLSTIYFYTKENKVYKYDENNHRLTLNNEPIFVLENDEVIEYSIDGTIKTNKNFYAYSSQIKNKEECEKYEDIKCIYEDNFYKVDKNISNQYKNIKFYKTVDKYSTIIVDINNNVYTNVVGG